jgi:ATP-dependent RNA helicase RhlE
VALSREMLQSPVTIAIQRKAAPASGITQAAWPVPSPLKPALLAELVKSGTIRSVIAFTRTKHRANRLTDYLSRNGIVAERIHGNRSQNQRTQALAGFKAGKFPVLVATDIAARGIDVEALSHVVNFDVPKCPEDYVHRVGRTARASATGDAFLFYSPEEEADVRGIERAIGKSLPRLTLPGFDYTRKPVVTHHPTHQAAVHPRRPSQQRHAGRRPAAGPTSWRSRSTRGRRSGGGQAPTRRAATR